MRTLLLWCGRLAGSLGILLSAIAIAARLAGMYTISQFQSGTVLQAGLAAMLVGCLGYLAAIAENERRDL